MIAVVVLTFDARDGMLEACLDALRQHSTINAGDAVDAGDAGAADAHVIVVDNARATRQLPTELRQEVDIVETGRNLGFAGGMNVGIERALCAGATAVIVMNDDVVVQPGWLPPLIAELESDASIGAVQPKLLYPGSPRRVNSLGVHLGPDGAGTDVGIGELDDAMATEAHDIELFTGGAVLLRAEMLRTVGVFDERFFLYYEDVDLGLRGRRAGWRYRCVPASCVVHEGGATVERVGDRAAFLRERNRLWILWRHRPWADVARGTWLSVRRLRWSPRPVHLRALIAGTAAAPRLLWERRARRSNG